MRIAIFTDSFHPELGGIQDAIASLGQSLGERGHAVLIVAPCATVADYRLAGLEPREARLGTRVTIARCPSVGLPGSTGQSRLMLPWHRWQPARAVLDRFRPDIIHLHTFLTAGREGLAEAARRALPVVGTNHWAIDSFDMYGPQRIARALARHAGRRVSRFYQRCNRVTAPSAELLEAMRAQGCDREAVVISNPIDIRRFQPPAPLARIRLRSRLGLTGPTLIYAGRLAREKRVDVLIRALALLGPGADAPALLVAGHGNELERLQALAVACGVADQVRFCGPLSRTALADHFRAADLFVTASTTETQCMALLQAMASGLPAVVADARALPETLGDAAGLLARADDAISFTRQIRRLLADPDHWTACARAARRRASACAIDVVTDHWESLYACLATRA